MDLNLTSSLVSAVFSLTFQDHLIHSLFQNILWILLLPGAEFKSCCRAAEMLRILRHTLI